MATESLRLRPLEGRGWHVLVMEELDGVGSKQVERYLKVKLETMLPAKCIVVATSNDTHKIDRALLERFGITLNYSAGDEFRQACLERLSQIWAVESDGADLPIGWDSWGQNGNRFSMRLALDLAQVMLLGRREAA